MASFSRNYLIENADHACSSDSSNSSCSLDQDLLSSYSSLDREDDYLLRHIQRQMLQKNTLIPLFYSSCLEQPHKQRYTHRYHKESHQQFWNDYLRPIVHIHQISPEGDFGCIVSTLHINNDVENSKSYFVQKLDYRGRLGLYQFRR